MIMASAVSVTDELSSRRRKLGNGYALALNTGNGTHRTLVYLHSGNVVMNKHLSNKWQQNTWNH